MLRSIFLSLGTISIVAIQVPLEAVAQTSSQSCAASGDESSNPNNYFGSIQINSNRFVYAESTQYTPFCWAFTVINNLSQGSSNGISSCVSSSWTTTYRPSTASMQFYEKAYQHIHFLAQDRIFSKRILLASRKNKYFSGIGNNFLNAQSSLNENRTFNAKSLLNSSDQEIADTALEWTRISFDVSGSLKVVLVRSVTVEDLSKLGLPEAVGVNSSKSLKLVVVKGDFDLTNMRGEFSSQKDKVKTSYVGYIFDLEAGVPTATLTSKNGGRFRKALNQPHLPDDLQPGESGSTKINAPDVSPVPLPAL